MGRGIVRGALSGRATAEGPPLVGMVEPLKLLVDRRLGIESRLRLLVGPHVRPGASRRLASLVRVLIVLGPCASVTEAAQCERGKTPQASIGVGPRAAAVKLPRSPRGAPASASAAARRASPAAKICSTPRKLRTARWLSSAGGSAPPNMLGSSPRNNAGFGSSAPSAAGLRRYAPPLDGSRGLRSEVKPGSRRGTGMLEGDPDDDDAVRAWRTGIGSEVGFADSTHPRRESRSPANWRPISFNVRVGSTAGGRSCSSGEGCTLTASLASLGSSGRGPSLSSSVVRISF